MKLEYDPEVDAAYLRLRHAAVTSTEEIAPGVLMDLAADGRPVGFELLSASERARSGPAPGTGCPAWCSDRPSRSTRRQA